MAQKAAPPQEPAAGPREPGAPRPTRRRRGGPRDARPAPWLAPLLAIVTLFYLYPAVQVFRFAFTDASLLRDDFNYGLGAFRATLTDPTFLPVVRITLTFVLASIVLQLALGLLIALAIQRGTQRRLPGTGFIRTLVLTSWVMPGIVIGIVWGIVLNDAQFGLVNSFLGLVGAEPVGFLSGSTTALGSVIVANVWRGTSFSMILQYAGLQSIDPTLYEAGEVDGASSWQAFWHITLPSLRPIIMINVVLIGIQTFNTFDMVLALTGGGPGRATEILALRTFNVLFREFSLGQASVFALVMLLLSLLFTLLYLRVLGPKEQR